MTDKAADNHHKTSSPMDALMDSLEEAMQAILEEKAAANKLIAQLSQQLASEAEALKALQTAHKHQATKVELLEAELSALQHERDALIKENAAAQESAAKFRQELSDQTETLRKVQQECIQRSQQLEQLESDFHVLRLRHLRHRRS